MGNKGDNNDTQFQLGVSAHDEAISYRNTNRTKDATGDDLLAIHDVYAASGLYSSGGAGNSRFYATIDTIEVAQADVTAGSVIVTLGFNADDKADLIQLAAVTLVPVDNHTVDFVYDDAEGNEHILSRQTVKTGDAAILPTNPLPKAFASVALADGETTANITADKKIKLNVTWK